ncbi:MULTISPECIES: hypothetical protein [Bacillus]|uniref:hypothetical protein n=1 Tax=Bacillus TaxID=1386 RepID=UPI00006AC2B0|nr:MULTISPECIES: hypothetical protein [Bacillus]EAR68043.1 hypothetical protein B14911_25330 [Bacillus sp. NRRL B-14911]MCA1035267.1 hypothetical protein [Bacillus infantis]MDT0162569.1 hypothetical protein [Bacillus sp. AG4(2022)]OXT18322.1 hypothetical protein B9K06_07425 [Bacillus sp. OG2]
MLANIRFKTIKVNQIQNSSGIFYGQNTPVYWQHTGKISEGFGKVAGKGNKISRNYTRVARSKEGS